MEKIMLFIWEINKKKRILGVKIKHKLLLKLQELEEEEEKCIVRT